MGRERALRTYGHHRNRVVSLETADIFHSGSGSRHHVFSTSSSESGLGPSDSMDSADASHTAFTGRRAKEKALQTLQAGSEEKTGSKVNKRKRQPMQNKGKLFISDKDTCSSSDCMTPAAKRITRRVLRDVSNDCEKQKTRRPAKCKRNPPKDKPPPTKNHSSINFSEFDDYSLVISDSPPALGGEKWNGKSDQTGRGVGTSTPCGADSSCIKPSPGLPTADLSYISAFDESVGVIGHDGQSPSFSLVSTPSLIPCQDSNASAFSNPSEQSTDGETREKGDDSDQRNLERLEESFASMRVGGRRLRKRKEPIERQCQKSDQSAELSPACDSLDGLVEDHLVTECKSRVQQLRESLIKSYVEALDGSQQNKFDTSCSLFDSPVGVERRGCMQRTLSGNMAGTTAHTEEENLSSAVAADSDSELDSATQGSENLSAIVEDGEEEEEEEDEEEEEEDEEDEDEEDEEEEGDKSDSGDSSDMESSQSCSVLLESPKEGSPVRYMLASLSCSDDLADASVLNDGNNSVLSSKKSLGANLTRSFAEVLTPSKAKTDSGKELSPRQSVLQECGQTEPLPFTTVIPASVLKKCVKVGEGVYGEVFRTKHNGQSVALKIIPIEGDFEVNDEPQKTFKEILPEIVISNELSRLREGEENNTTNFCPVKSVSLVRGHYPPELLKQWDIFHEKKNSENDRPDVFGEDQLYILFEFGDGGCDLDGCKLKNAAQAISLLQQVAGALAVAEEVLCFEHRDLHVGNILVQSTRQTTLTLILNNTPIFIDTQGIHVSIIDFTLSRLTKDGCTVFCDLSSDDTLFEGKGDYQFDIYRMMKAENKNQWEAYQPYTNVLWLHYLCDKLINHKRFQETDRSHRDSLKRLRQTHSKLLCYSSAAHFVLEDTLFDS